jgi:hypothetical protein
MPSQTFNRQTQRGGGWYPSWTVVVVVAGILASKHDNHHQNHRVASIAIVDGLWSPLPLWSKRPLACAHSHVHKLAPYHLQMPLLIFCFMSASVPHAYFASRFFHTATHAHTRPHRTSPSPPSPSKHAVFARHGQPCQGLNGAFDRGSATALALRWQAGEEDHLHRYASCRARGHRREGGKEGGKEGKRAYLHAI